MPDTMEKLKISLANGIIDLSLMSGLEDDYRELQHKADEFEKLLS
jgi:hypothetical protein